MHKILAFLLVAGLLLTASPVFAAPPSEAAKQGPPVKDPSHPVTPTTCPVTPTITITGTLTSELVGDCYNYFVTTSTVNRVEFGPKWYITTATAKFDYDGKNGIQTIVQELNGLVGTSVTLVAKLCKDGSYEVFKINGMVYRDESGPPPWSGGPKGKGKK